MTILSEPGAALLIICAWHADFDRTDPRNANFGKVTQQFNLPGSAQIAFKLLF